MVYIKQEGSVFVRIADGWQQLKLERVFKDPDTIPESFLSSAKPLTKPDLKPVPTPETSPPVVAHTHGLRLVALNAPLSGDMSGIRGADLQCYLQAREARLHGTFRAFLSSPTQNLLFLVKQSDRTQFPILNLRGQRLFPSWSSLFSVNGAQLGANIPLYSFNGVNVLQDPFWPYKAVWHGATLLGKSVPWQTCDDWRRSTRTGLAGTLQGGSSFLTSRPVACSTPLIVLCIENAYPYSYMW
uniref:Collagenase NC10/endostatin domain-containing protein n=2 Tax=Erpetoichthys calabaricus TaxID=27687 RepID=A0A8C4XEI3_ERPCA